MIYRNDQRGRLSLLAGAMAVQLLAGCQETENGDVAKTESALLSQNPVNIIGVEKVEFPGPRASIVAVGRPGTPLAGRIFRGATDQVMGEIWKYISPVRIVDDDSRNFLADVDGDGFADLISVGGESGGAAGWIAVGIANKFGFEFAQWSWLSNHRVLSPGQKFWFADVNNDRKADLVIQGAAGSPSAGKVFVGLSNGTGFTEWSSTSPQRVLEDNSKTWVVDVNNDQKADLVTQGQPGGATAGWVAVGLSNGTSFAQWTWVSNQRVLEDNSKSWLADVNADGKADLVTQGQPGGATAGWVAVGLSNGTSFAQWTWVSNKRVLDDNSKTWLVDINDDRKADLVTQGEPGGSAAGWIAVGLSNGTSFPQWTWTSNARRVEDDTVSYFADVDGAGKKDLIAFAPKTGNIYAGYSDGTSFGWWSYSFVQAQPTAVPRAPSQLKYVGVSPSNPPGVNLWQRFSFTDLNPAAPLVAYQWAEVNSSGAIVGTGYNGNPGSLSGQTRWIDMPNYDLANHTSGCIKYRGSYSSTDWSNATMWSNVACIPGMAGPPAMAANVGLGNGVLVTDPGLTDFNYFPRATDDFRIAFYVCNNGNVASANLPVKVVEYREGQMEETYNLPSVTVPAGACILRNTDVINVFSTSFYHWEVYVGGAYQGGTGMRAFL